MSDLFALSFGLFLVIGTSWVVIDSVLALLLLILVADDA